MFLHSVFLLHSYHFTNSSNIGEKINRNVDLFYLAQKKADVETSAGSNKLINYDHELFREELRIVQM